MAVINFPNKDITAEIAMQPDWLFGQPVAAPNNPWDRNHRKASHAMALAQRRYTVAAMGDSNVTALVIPPKKRAANKLSQWDSSPRFTAVIDALLDIRPRRTLPTASTW